MAMLTQTFLDWVLHHERIARHSAQRATVVRTILFWISVVLLSSLVKTTKARFPFVLYTVPHLVAYDQMAGLCVLIGRYVR